MSVDHRKSLGAVLLLVSLSSATARGAEDAAALGPALVPPTPVPLARAHAHNDYEHERPLLDALSHGFTSVEADIFLVGDALLVAHHRLQLRKERTLASLYLDPLLERVRKNGGRVYPGGGEFTLLIDLKTDAEETWRALSRGLEPYAEMLTEVRDGKEIRRAVRVILSGNRPRETLAAEKRRFAGHDGRLADLARLREKAARGEALEDETLEPPHFLPLVSDRWTDHFTYRGRGEFPAEERERLAEIVRVAHAAGRRLRFWATADTPAMWAVLLESGVDHINTDDLPGLAAFLREHEVAKPADASAPPEGSVPSKGSDPSKKDREEN